MKRGIKHLLKGAALFGGLLGVLLSSATVKAATGEAEENGIKIEISTDKDSYEAGEEVNYVIKVSNDRANWFISETEFTYSNSESLVPANGDLPNTFSKVSSGDTVEINGTVRGNAAAGETKESASDESKSSGNFVLWASLAGAVITGIIITFILFGKKNKKAAGLILIISSAFMMTGLSAKAVASYEEVTLRPYVSFTYGNEEVMIRIVAKMHLFQEKLDLSQYAAPGKRVTCHDPSIFKDFDGRYYIFGTHLAAGYTDDLLNWYEVDGFSKSFTDDEIKKISAWNGDAVNGSVKGYLWAPDVIYNPALGKYCMYLSADGDYWKSNIVLLTADVVTGPYSYAGSVVYGGFTQDTMGETDVSKVLGTDELPERYIKNGIANKKWGDMWPNCIDPCVFYADDGKLYMCYGSWSGGIFMLELDENTGLRDYSVTYEENIHSDPYFGKKIAGGAYVSGEGSYIQKIGDYYYLFISYGGLEAASGYNVRVYRSDKPDGDYVDALGNDAFSDSYVMNYNLENKGVRLFGGYKWRNFNYGQVAQGHNSAFVDDDGRAYIIFHTRTDDGTEGHYVKAHQLFVNKEGWLVAAPYKTSGEKLETSLPSKSEIAGDYEVILHELDIDYGSLETKKSKVINLSEDGIISGEYTGTWDCEPRTNYITLRIDGITYSGVSLMMNIEGTSLETRVFSALGIENQLTFWGTKMVD